MHEQVWTTSRRSGDRGHLRDNVDLTPVGDRALVVGGLGGQGDAYVDGGAGIMLSVQCIVREMLQGKSMLGLDQANILTLPRLPYQVYMTPVKAGRPTHLRSRLFLRPSSRSAIA